MSSIRKNRRADRSRDQLPRGAGIGACIGGLLLALLLGGGCAERVPSQTASTPAPAAAARDAGEQGIRPPFFRIEGGRGATLLLLGTVHLGPVEGWTFSPAMQSGLRASSSAVLELDPAASGEDEVGDRLADLVILEPPTRLADVIAPETQKLLDEQDATLTAMGMPPNARVRMKPWYIAALLLEINARRSGFSMESAVDHAVADAMQGRPIAGLETLEEQLRLFDDLPPELQDLMLRDTLAHLDVAIEEIGSLVSAWRAGDEARLIAIAQEGVDELPELQDFYDVLLRDRNLRWIETLGALLDAPDRRGETIFVAVGALHVVGPEGVPSLLREAGYRVAAIDHEGSL